MLVGQRSLAPLIGFVWALTGQLRIVASEQPVLEQQALSVQEPLLMRL